MIDNHKVKHDDDKKPFKHDSLYHINYHTSIQPISHQLPYQYSSSFCIVCKNEPLALEYFDSDFQWKPKCYCKCMNSKFILQSLKPVRQKTKPKKKKKIPLVFKIGHLMCIYVSPSKINNTNKNQHKNVPASMTSYNKKKNSRLVISFWHSIQLMMSYNCIMSYM